MIITKLVYQLNSVRNFPPLWEISPLVWYLLKTRGGISHFYWTFFNFNFKLSETLKKRVLKDCELTSGVLSSREAAAGDFLLKSYLTQAIFLIKWWFCMTFKHCFYKRKMLLSGTISSFFRLRRARGEQEGETADIHVPQIYYSDNSLTWLTLCKGGTLCDFHFGMLNGSFFLSNLPDCKEGSFAVIFKFAMGDPLCFWFFFSFVKGIVNFNFQFCKGGTLCDF